MNKMIHQEGYKVNLFQDATESYWNGLQNKLLDDIAKLVKKHFECGSQSFMPLHSL